MQGEGHNFDFKELLAVCQAGRCRLWKRKYGKFAALITWVVWRKCHFDAVGRTGNAVYAATMAENSGR